MNCRQTHARFDERLDGRLDQPTCTAFDRHVAVCPACGPAWNQYTASWQMLTRPEAIEPSFGFVERTLRRLDEQPQPATHWLLAACRWAVVGSAAAVLLTSGWLLWERVQTHRAGALYAAVSATDFVEDFDVIASLDLIEKQDRK